MKAYIVVQVAGVRSVRERGVLALALALVQHNDVLRLTIVVSETLVRTICETTHTPLEVAAATQVSMLQMSSFPAALTLARQEEVYYLW